LSPDKIPSINIHKPHTIKINLTQPANINKSPYSKSDIPISHIIKKDKDVTKEEMEVMAKYKVNIDTARKFID
jgi:hypothetical protein